MQNSWQYKNIKNMYHMSEIAEFESVQIPVNLISKEIMQQRNLVSKIHNGYVYCKITLI